MARICVFDSKWQGHHASYVKQIARELVDLGHHVHVACPAPEEVQASLEPQHSLSYSTTTEFGALRPFRRLSRLPFHMELLLRARLAHRQATNAGGAPDMTFFCMLDDVASTSLSPALADRVFPWPWSGLIVQPWSHDPARLRHSLLRSRNCRCVFMLDETLTQPLERLLAKPCHSFPDIADISAPGDSSIARDMLAKAAGRKIILLAGILNLHKGLPGFLRLAEALPEDQFLPAIVGHGAGTQAQAVVPWIRRKMSGALRNRLFFHEGRIPAEQAFNALIAAADMIWVAYSRHPFSSNMLTKAAAFEKPVIAVEGTLLGNRVREHGIGLCVDVRDPHSVASKLAHFFSERPISAAAFHSYADRHGRQALRTALGHLV